MKKETEAVNSFKRKYKNGFTQSEIKELLNQFPNIGMEKFNDALMGVTGMKFNNELIIYKHDIIQALVCGNKNKDLDPLNWD